MYYMIHVYAVSAKTINLRDLPEEFVRRAKACAALHGLTLKGFVLDAVEKAINKDIPARSMAATLLGVRPQRRKRKSRRRGKRALNR